MTIDWTEIVREYGPVVWKTVRRILSHDADSADCFQETFVSALKLAVSKPIGNWPGLLQKLATARALDTLRRRIRGRRTIEISGEMATSDDPVMRAQASELRDRLRSALAELPPAHSEVFCLRHLSEMSYEEISRQTGMSIDAVGVNLHRARAQLRTLLNEYAGELKRS